MTTAAFFSILSAIILGLLAITVRRKFMPVLELRIATSCTDKDPRLLTARVEIRNTSLVIADPIAARFQALPYLVRRPGFLPDFVPFQEERLTPAILGSEDASYEVLTWQNAHTISHPVKVEPGETVTFDVAYSTPECDVVHCGFQIEYKLTRLSWALGHARADRDATDRPLADRSTTTAWVVVPKSAGFTAVDHSNGENGRAGGA